ncbi:MAG: CapA family protein [Candidatus Poribacteria bacterium]|nr:CapA family protein [Candidatus Poribacteria bacterium]
MKRAARIAAFAVVCALTLSAHAEAWTLRVVGNLHFGKNWTTYFEKEGPEYPFAQIAEFLSDADWTVGFFEGVASGREGLAPFVNEPLLSSSLAAEALRVAGFDAVSLASPRIMDYGLTGLQQTVGAFDAVGLVHFGAGENLTLARTLGTARVNEHEIAFAAFLHGVSRAHAEQQTPGANILAPSILKADMASAEAASDAVIVFIRWEYSAQEQVTGKQKLLARMAVDAGADAVFGVRGRELQGVEIYRDRPIFYGLGEFVRGVDVPRKHGRVMIPTVAFDGELPMRVDLTPVRVDTILESGQTLQTKLQPRLLTGKEAEPPVNLFTRLCEELGTAVEKTDGGLRIQIQELP